MALRLSSRHLARLCKNSTVSAPRKWVPTTGSIASLHQIAAANPQHEPSVPQRPTRSPWAEQRRLKHAGKKGELFPCAFRGLTNGSVMRGVYIISGRGLIAPGELVSCTGGGLIVVHMVLHGKCRYTLVATFQGRATLRRLDSLETTMRATPWNMSGRTVSNEVAPR